MFTQEDIAWAITEANKAHKAEMECFKEDIDIQLHRFIKNAESLLAKGKYEGVAINIQNFLNQMDRILK